MPHQQETSKNYVKMTTLSFEKKDLTKGNLISNKRNGCWTHIQFFHKVLLNVVAHYCISNSTSSQSFWQNVIEINHLTSAHTNSLLKKSSSRNNTEALCLRHIIIVLDQNSQCDTISRNFCENVEDQFEIEMILWKKFLKYFV